MAGDGIRRRLRGAIGNGLLWGAAWSAFWVVVVVVWAVLGVVGIVPALSWLEVIAAILRFGVAFGIIGFVTGGAFSGVVRLLYHGRRLSELSWVRFGVGGGVTAGLFVPVFLQTMNWLSGDGLVPWELLQTDAILAAVFGGVAAGGSIKVAQLSGALLPDGKRDELDRPETAERHLTDARRST